MILPRSVMSYDSKLHRFAEYWHEGDVIPFTFFLVSVASGFALIFGLGIGLITGSWMYMPKTPSQTVVAVEKVDPPPRFKKISRDLIDEVTFVYVVQDTIMHECYAYTQYRYGGSGMAYSDLTSVRCKE